MGNRVVESCRTASGGSGVRGWARVSTVAVLLAAAASLSLLSTGTATASAAHVAGGHDVTADALTSETTETGPGVQAYIPGTPSLATVTSPSSCTGTTCAPWNTSQGTATATAYPETKLLPTFTPDGPTTTATTPSTKTTVTEPNVSVVSGAKSGKVTGGIPYPAGVVGTPGPLDDYCGPGTHTAESGATRAVSRQPAGTTLPFSPAYFPHVVKDSTGKLTGYFDYRPKTADEALVAATATATGKSWTYDGEALEQNPGYCPSADVNDDGEGHANIVHVAGATFLYTLPRAAGDMQGVGLVVHRFTPSVTKPLTGLPRDERTGIDPDAFATGAVTVGASSVTVPVTTTGSAGSTEQLLSGGFVDLNDDSTKTWAATATITDVFDCSVSLGSDTLTGCTAAKSGKTVVVHAGDLIEQVLGYTAKKATVPAGPNLTVGTGGLKKITVVTTDGGTTAGFTNRLTGTTFNTNSPNRAYVGGVTVYCSQANTNPTTKIEGCTTGPDGKKVTIPKGSPVLTDPIVPPTASTTQSGDGMTTGLVAPDGIVGVLPTYPGAPKTATIVLYTEKELSYFVAGVTPKTTVATTTETTFGSTIPFTPGPYESQDMPATISPADPVAVSMGDMTTTAIITVTCTGMTTGSTTDTLTGCSVPPADEGNKYTSSSWIGAPGATTVPYSTLKLTGEGKTTPKKLDKNNQDLTVLRVAYTTTGVHFEDANLANTGIISGKGTEGSSSYDDINDPTGQTNPTDASGTIDLNEYAKAGTEDATEMRWVGSDGTIVTNPDGTIGLFLSGSWAADGDSDAFNQIFYTQSSTGEYWSVPRTVISTDYTFAASQRATTSSSPTYGKRLTISAYYEGRAYGPTVVADGTGKLTMVFAGYRTPKGTSSATDVLGTGYTGAPQWTVGKEAPNLYRNILTATLSPVLDTTTTLTVTPSSPVYGETVTLSATVAVPGDPTAAPTGQITFGDTTGTLCTATLSGGTPDVASCTHVFDGVGTFAVTASYAGDATDTASHSTSTTVTVGRAHTATVVSVSPTTPVVGQEVTLEATVTVPPPASGVPTGTVSFFSATGGPPLCTVPLSGTTTDVAICTVTFSGVGKESITAEYLGSTDFTTSVSPPAPVTLGTAPTSTTLSSSVDPSVSGQPVTFTATVAAAPPGGGTPTGAVTFTLRPSGSPPGLEPIVCAGGDTQPLSGTTATCALPGGLPASESPVMVTAAYGGSTTYMRSATRSPLVQTVDQAASSVDVESAPAQPVSGQPVRFSATLTAVTPGSGTPTGNVSWRVLDGAGKPVTCVPAARFGLFGPNGPVTASCTVPRGTVAAAEGPYTVTATYGGSADFTSGTGTLSVTVSKAATRTALFVQAPFGGRAGSVTATVSAAPPGSGTPTGTVTFVITATDGKAVACQGGNTATLRHGRASCSVPSDLAASGSPYTVTSNYSGDDNFASSTGGPIMFSVRSGPPV